MVLTRVEPPHFISHLKQEVTIVFSFHHVSLSVESIELSMEFYSALGFKKVYEWQAEDRSLRVAHLKSGTAFIEIFCYLSPQAAPKTTKELSTDLPRIGVKHFALKVKSITEAKDALIEKGLINDAEITRGNTEVDYFFLRDPDGIWVEIVQDERGL